MVAGPEVRKTTLAQRLRAAPLATIPAATGTAREKEANQPQNRRNDQHVPKQVQGKPSRPKHDKNYKQHDQRSNH